MRIIEIAGVQLVVSDKDYNYYWTRRNIGENSDAFKVACRRLLGLGPDSHSFDYGFIQSLIPQHYNLTLFISS